MNSLEKKETAAARTEETTAEETATAGAEETAAAGAEETAKFQLLDVLESMTSCVSVGVLAKLMPVSKIFNTALKEKLTPVHIEAMEAMKAEILEKKKKVDFICAARRLLEYDYQFKPKYCAGVTPGNCDLIRRLLVLFVKNCDGLPIEKFNKLYESRQVDLLFDILKPQSPQPESRDRLCSLLREPPSVFTRGAIVKLGPSKILGKISSVTLTGERDKGKRENGHLTIELNETGSSVNVGFDEVESLTLNGTQLTDLDLDGIEMMRNLGELNLENNQLECLPPLFKVRTLNVSNNKIKFLTKCRCDSLTGSHFDIYSIKGLEELLVNNNQITSLEGVIFYARLTRLELSGNPLTCLDKTVLPISLNVFELDAQNVTSLTDFEIPTHLLPSLNFAPGVLSKYVTITKNTDNIFYRNKGRTITMFLLKPARESDSHGGAAGHGDDKEYAQGNTSGRSLSHRGRGNKSKTRRRQRQRQSKRNKLQRKNKYSRRRQSAKSKSK